MRPQHITFALLSLTSRLLCDFAIACCQRSLHHFLSFPFLFSHHTCAAPHELHNMCAMYSVSTATLINYKKRYNLWFGRGSTSSRRRSHYYCQYIIDGIARFSHSLLDDGLFMACSQTKQQQNIRQSHTPCGSVKTKQNKSSIILKKVSSRIRALCTTETIWDSLDLAKCNK